MRALIAEDEPLLAEDLRQRLTQLWPALDIVGVVHDGLAARQALIELKPEVAFLDIRMPGMSGLEAACAAAPECRLVFVTAYEEHAVAAFEHAAADYLLKPVSDTRLKKCVHRLQQNPPVSAQNLLAQLRTLLPAEIAPATLQWLRVQVGQELRLIAVEQVCYFHSADKYTRVVTRDLEHLLRTSLKELAAQLHPEQFWQIHRSTLVNVHQIKSAKRDLLGRLTLILHDRPETLTVSRAYTHLFRQM